MSNQRANSKNPNNPAYKAAINNRSNQLNSNNHSFHSSRKQVCSYSSCSLGGHVSAVTPIFGCDNSNVIIQNGVRISKKQYDMLRLIFS